MDELDKMLYALTPDDQLLKCEQMCQEFKEHMDSMRDKAESDGEEAPNEEIQFRGWICAKVSPLISISAYINEVVCAKVSDLEEQVDDLTREIRALKVVEDICD